MIEHTIFSSLDPDRFFNLTRIAKQTFYSFYKHRIEVDSTEINPDRSIFSMSPPIFEGTRTPIELEGTHKIRKFEKPLFGTIEPGRIINIKLDNCP